MDRQLKRRVVVRLQRLLAYWGVLEHPYGRDYIREAYSATGRPKE